MLHTFKTDQRITCGKFLLFLKMCRANLCNKEFTILVDEFRETN